MKTKDWFKNKLDSFRDDFEFRLESLILNITENISKRMVEKKINRSSLAEKLNVSPPAVTKILNGSSNFTLKTLLSLSDALDLDLNIEFKDKKSAIAEGAWATVYVPAIEEMMSESAKAVGVFTEVSSTSNRFKKEITYDEAA
jgi:transcriptional regulator with XRE-family HTH domain